MTLSFAVIYGSVRTQRKGIRVARFVVRQLEARGHVVHLIDPLEYPLPLLDKMYKEYEGDAPEVMQQIASILIAADAIVVVSGEYNHGVPPALKNLLDHFQKEYFFKPAAIVSYSRGPFGGVRGAVQLRAILPELGMTSIPSMFPVSKVSESFDEDGNALDENYPRRIVRFLDELEWFTRALKHERDHGTPY